jgi:hypothetical protein
MKRGSKKAQAWAIRVLVHPAKVVRLSFAKHPYGLYVNHGCVNRFCEVGGLAIIHKRNEPNLATD